MHISGLLSLPHTLFGNYAFVPVFEVALYQMNKRSTCKAKFDKEAQLKAHMTECQSTKKSSSHEYFHFNTS
jgi:hypothetical protein